MYQSADEIKAVMVSRGIRAARIGWKALLDEEMEVTPVPRDEWPIPIRALATARSAGELGIGDTAARMIGAFGGRIFEGWWQSVFGYPCGCDDRHAWLNARYPYEVS